MNYPTMEAWHEALEAAQRDGTHHAVEINSPVCTRWDGKRGYYDRWGVFKAAPAIEAAHHERAAEQAAP